MIFNIIDEIFLVFLMFGVWTCLMIAFGYWMGKRLPGIRFIKGDPIPDPQASYPDPGSANQDYYDGYQEALYGPGSGPTLKE